MPIPKRTGLTTAFGLARSLKKILQKFFELYTTILTSEELAKVTSLINCISDFLEDVPQYPTEP